jgi:hypothetical protein
MSWLRFASALVLALWVGGLVTLAMAGPQVFATLEARDPANGRAVAGFVFGALVEYFLPFSWMLAAALLAALGLRAVLGPRPRRFAIRVWVVATMLVLSVAVNQWVTPRIAAIRDDAGGQVSALPTSDPRRTEFGRLHALSNAFMIVTIVAGVGLLFAEIHDER